MFPAGGDVGVVFFLMLSGFVMTYGYGGSGGCVAAVGALHSSLAFCAANGAVCLAVVIPCGALLMATACGGGPLTRLLK